MCIFAACVSLVCKYLAKRPLSFWKGPALRGFEPPAETTKNSEKRSEAQQIVQSYCLQGLSEASQFSVGIVVPVHLIILKRTFGEVASPCESR